MCLDCFRWHKEGDVLEKNRSVFIYNHWMKEVMARYKFRGDCAIVHAFAKEFRAAFRLYYGSNYEIVPIPLSEERLMERGFNQAQLLASLLPSSGPPCSLVRVHTEKQSQKTRQERLGGISPFSFSSPERFDGRRILLIDDIYTTGTTLRQAAALFRERGAAGVSSLTLCRS
ncbi:MAG: ComF family protein [Ectobacillus sp.]